MFLTQKKSRTKSQVSQPLPIFMTRVDNYGSKEKLIDCSYHKFEINTSMDVKIYCGSDDDTIGAHQAHTALNASLSISVNFAVVFIALLAVLIIIAVLRQMKNSKKRFVVIISFSSS